MMGFVSETHALYIVSGFSVGAIVGLTGVGGGSLMTPLLVLLFGVHPATAVGTDLLQACVTKTAGTLVHGRNHAVDWRIVKRLATGSIPGTTIGLIILAHLDLKGSTATHLISLVLGVALLLTAVSILFRDRLVRLALAHRASPDPGRAALWTIAFGGIVGLLVSISSIGAGAIGVTALLLIYPTIPMHKLVGSDIAHAVPLTLIAGLGHWVLGSVNQELLVWLLVGSVPGIVLSSMMARLVPELALRPILATTLALVGSRLVR